MHLGKWPRDLKAVLLAVSLRVREEVNAREVCEACSHRLRPTEGKAREHILAQKDGGEILCLLSWLLLFFHVSPALSQMRVLPHLRATT